MVDVPARTLLRQNCIDFTPLSAPVEQRFLVIDVSIEKVEVDGLDRFKTTCREILGEESARKRCFFHL